MVVLRKSFLEGSVPITSQEEKEIEQEIDNCNFIYHFGRSRGKITKLSKKS